MRHASGSHPPVCGSSFCRMHDHRSCTALQKQHTSLCTCDSWAMQSDCPMWCATRLRHTCVSSFYAYFLAPPPFRDPFPLHRCSPLYQVFTGAQMFTGVPCPPPLCSGAFTTCRTCSCTFTACHTFRPTCLLTACHGTPDGLVCWFNRELRIVLQQLKGGCACYDFLIHFLSSRSTAESASPTCMYQRPTGGTSHAGSMVSLRNAASYSANMHCSLIHECESHGKAQRMRDAGTL
jgi:hypothetical protein